MSSVLKGSSNWSSDDPMIKSRYVSPAQTITSSGLITLTHGLTDRDGNPVKPFHISAYAKCLVAELDFSVGDEVELSLVNNANNVQGRVNAVWTDQSIIGIRFTNNSSCFTISTKSEGSMSGITNANWELYVRAWA